MLSLHGWPIALQTGVPALLLAWVIAGRHRSITAFLVKLVAVVLSLVAIHLGGLWVVLPWYTTLGFLVLVFAGVFQQRSRIRSLPWRAPLSWGARLVHAAAMAVAIGLFAGVVLGRLPPAAPVVELQFPLANGTYHAVHAGSLQLINAHLMTLAGDRFAAFRGQSYGVDLVKLGPLGFRATGLLPETLAKYAIYGDEVYAPCAGVVIAAFNDAADMVPPQPDRAHMAGNHVLIDCDGAYVLLAHFQRGSVRVRAGERIAGSTVLGLVGNSGNSNEPHLHVHAQRPPGVGAPPLSGEPLPVRFNGHYLVRNSRVTSTAAARQ
jgi:hypothetical protein